MGLWQRIQRLREVKVEAVFAELRGGACMDGGIMPISPFNRWIEIDKQDGEYVWSGPFERYELRDVLQFKKGEAHRGFAQPETEEAG